MPPPPSPNKGWHGHPSGLNARFVFIQSKEKIEYFLSVLKSLASICSGKYREYSYLDKRTLFLTE